MEDVLFCLYVVVGFIAIVFVIQVFLNNKSLRIVNDGLRAIVKQDGITRLSLEKEIMICNQTNKDLMEMLRQRPSKSENQEELIKMAFKAYNLRTQEGEASPRESKDLREWAINNIKFDNLPSTFNKD